MYYWEKSRFMQECSLNRTETTLHEYNKSFKLCTILFTTPRMVMDNIKLANITKQHLLSTSTIIIIDK